MFTQPYYLSDIAVVVGEQVWISGNVESWDLVGRIPPNFDASAVYQTLPLWQDRPENFDPKCVNVKWSENELTLLTL